MARAKAEGKELPVRGGKRVWLFIETVTQEKDGQDYAFRRVVRVTERTIDKRGHALLVPEITLEGWWTSPHDAGKFSDEQVIELYAAHGTSEQFHSEFKTVLTM